VLDHLDDYLHGALTTISLTAWAWAVAFVLGTTVAAFRVSPVPPLRWAATAYVETVRNCPLTVLFVLFFFGLPDVGLTWGRFTSAVIVLGLYTGAFVAEVVRAGVNTVAAGQAEAARAIGLTFPQVLFVVVLPQALRAVVAPLGNLLIALVKNTAIAYTISVIELTGTAQRIAVETADFFPVFLGAAAAYLLIAMPLGWAVAAIEHRTALRR
jgi:His/Glu/Gln/Arg/opine family amino acid ABC transporter permease subunit